MNPIIIKKSRDNMNEHNMNEQMSYYQALLLCKNLFANKLTLQRAVCDHFFKGLSTKHLSVEFAMGEESLAKSIDLLKSTFDVYLDLYTSNASAKEVNKKIATHFLSSATQKKNILAVCELLEYKYLPDRGLTVAEKTHNLKPTSLWRHYERIKHFVSLFELLFIELTPSTGVNTRKALFESHQKEIIKESRDLILWEAESKLALGF